MQTGCHSPLMSCFNVVPSSDVSQVNTSQGLFLVNRVLLNITVATWKSGLKAILVNLRKRKKKYDKVGRAFSGILGHGIKTTWPLHSGDDWAKECRGRETETLKMRLSL